MNVAFTFRSGLYFLALLLPMADAFSQEPGQEKTKPAKADSAKVLAPIAAKTDLPSLVRDVSNSGVRTLKKIPLDQFAIENIALFFSPSAKDPQKGEIQITIFSKEHFILELSASPAGIPSTDSLRKFIENVVLGRISRYNLIFKPSVVIDTFAKIDTLLAQSQNLLNDKKARQVSGIQEIVIGRIYNGSVASAASVLDLVNQPASLRETMFKLNRYFSGAAGDLWVHHLLKAFIALPLTNAKLAPLFSDISALYAEDKVSFEYFAEPTLADYRPLYILFNRFAKSKLAAAFGASNNSLAAGLKSDSLDQGTISKLLPLLSNPSRENKLDYPYPPASKIFSLSSQYEICSQGLALTDVIKPFNPFDHGITKLSQRFFDPNFRVTQFIASQVIARLLLVDLVAGARVSLMASPINVPAIARDYPSWVCLATGTYTSPDGKIASLAYRQGKLLSSLIRFNDGLVFMSPQGRAAVASAKHLRLIDVFRRLNLGQPKANGNAAETRRLFDYLRIFENHEDYLLLTRFIEGYQLTLVQGHLLVDDHAIVVRPDQARANRRLLLQFNDGSLGLFLGLPTEEAGKTLYEAAQIAADLNADYAFNLDAGGWDWGLLKIADNEVALGTSQTDHLSNVIVFDCHQ